MRFKVRRLEIDTAEAAKRELELTHADEAGVARMIDKARFAALKVEGLKPAAGNILKQEMLTVGGDAAVARGVINCGVETTDSVIMGTRKQLKQLVRRLKPQPFGLKVMGQEIARELKLEREEFVLPLPGGRELDLSGKPAVMGIINVTPDSFSDGGDNARIDAAVASGKRMVQEGADLLDIGGESTRPGAREVGEDEELARVIPVIEQLCGLGVPVSIDTYKASVAAKAVAAGATIINDVSGLRLDPEIGAVAADTGAGLIVMHMRGTPRDMQTDTGYDDLVGEIYTLLGQSLAAALDAGVEEEKVVVDPGIGFGKSVQGNLMILKRLREFASLGRPLLVGASRKSFIGKTLDIEDPKDRLEGSLVAAALAVSSGAQILRVHDVAPTRRAADMAWAVREAHEE